MLRELYFRDESDPKFKPELIETNSKLEAVLNKVKMILFSNRGEVLGEPNLGLNLDDYLFTFNFDAQELKSNFNAQVNQFIPEQSEFKISMDVSFESDNVQNYLYIYITINQQVMLTISI